MNLMFNNQPFISGGNLKITDFLEDPVDISTLTWQQIYDKVPHSILFADFYIGPAVSNKASREPKYLKGYIPLYRNASQASYAYPGNVPMAYIETSYNKYSFGINWFIIDANGEPSRKNWSIISNEVSPDTTVNLGDYIGKIWIGKYKQQVQE